MSVGTDSRVIDALQASGGLERLLGALGCDTAKDSGPSFDSPHGFIHCPMPDHPDAHPSCSILADAGLFACRSSCGTIRPLDLVIAHGHAATRGDAAKWVESALNLPTTSAGGDARPVVTDPSLSVAQYLALKHLSQETRARFDLRDVRVNLSAKHCPKTHRADFEQDWYGAVLLPCDPPSDTAVSGLTNRPRVRTWFGARWPAQVEDYTGVRTRFAFPEKTDNPYPHRPYGLPQFVPAPSDSMLARTLILVEGESDVHALHDMGIACCIGLPGVGGAAASMPDIVAQLLHAEQGDVDRLAAWSVAVWTEPGPAGSSLPGRVSQELLSHCGNIGMPAPRVCSIPFSSIVLPGPAASPKDPCELVALLHNLYLGDTPRARAEAGRLISEAVFQRSGQTTAQLDPAAPAAAIEPAHATIPDPVKLAAGGDPWELMACDAALPAPSTQDLPVLVEQLGARFVRTSHGWAQIVKDKDGDDVERPICSIVECCEVQRIGDVDTLVLRSPRSHTQQFDVIRLEREKLADTRSTMGALMSIGVSCVPRQGPSIVALIQALGDLRIDRSGVTHISTTTGWSSGTELFAGIECEPANDFGRDMFEANERRRNQHPDTQAAAGRYWRECIAPLIAAPDGETRPCHAAPLLAIGAAGAAILIKQLKAVGVNCSPVVWMAGMGGGGKSVTQRVCAGIYAPTGGQHAYSMGGDASQAAIAARVDSCMDLPLIVDDMERMRAFNTGPQRNAEAAKVESGAALGMMIFNQQPIERATRNGTVRKTRPFRSTALFSAEASMRTPGSRAVITAGHRRRITTIEARPMTERGLGPAFAATVNRAQELGGALGELHVKRSRELTARALRALTSHCDAALRATSPSLDVTQRSSLGTQAIGFASLAESSGEHSFDEALELFLAGVGAYLGASASDGGATHDDDLTRVSEALDKVAHLLASQPHRFERLSFGHDDFAPQAPMRGWLGKMMRPTKDGLRRVAMYADGDAELGIESQTLEQAERNGVLKRSYQVRVHGDRMRCSVWTLPLRDPKDDDPDGAPEPHDPDPHGLASGSAPRVPGASVSSYVAEKPPESTPENTPETTPTGELLTAESSVCIADAPIGADSIRSSQRDEPAVCNDPGDAGVDVSMFDEFAEMQAARDASGERVIVYEEGDEVMDFRFGWGSGLYKVGSADTMRDNPSLLKTIREDAAGELEALATIYARAAETDPDGAVEVAPFPPDDDERWLKIDQVGQEAARKVWLEVSESLSTANSSTDPAARLAAHQRHVRAYRIHLMCRYRRPEWFVVDVD